ncbi:flagellar basal-body MS-ring/collar protein FliF [Rouxiella chamberiensis]|uniref:flagellar basal-body MS-ring/collar protein FliF n=1 Tax=Rouxiella chamberiensis TaxID=1513468 RepID=UPI0005D33B0C|nr:flagellar basal-body MS-ring/collar protein FliF [Rouxiella chamberiensis]
MLDKIKHSLRQITLPRGKNPLFVAAAALVMTAAIALSLWGNSANYVALFGSQENIPVAQVVEVLGGEAIAYRVNPDSGQILVKDRYLARARMALAAKGITALTPSGYELMDKEQMLGSSQFMQNVRYKRSLEGELAQSIMALDAVEHARVHLAMVEPSAFVVSTRPESSASVIVHLRYGQRLNDAQVGAVIQLVAGSVPGMKGENVRVVDQHGNLLSESYIAEHDGVPSAKNGRELAERLKNDTRKNLGDLLVSIVGANNFRLSITPIFNLSRVEETEERLSGAPKVSDENINQENTTNELALGIPGSLSNRPASKVDAASPQALSTRNQAQRKYAYDREIRHVRYPGYVLEKMSIAIVLNQSAPQLAKWTDAQLNSLNTLMTNAAGLDSTRGDVLTLKMMAFTPQPDIDMTPLLWWQDTAAQRWAEILIAGLLALLLIIFVVRPAVRHYLIKQGSTPQTETGSETPDTGELSAAETLDNLTRRNVFESEEAFLPLSSGIEEKIACLQALTLSETDRVAEVIKQWINCHEQSDPQ